MNVASNNSDSDAAWLIAELEDGTISPDDRARLMDLLRSNPSVRDLYLAHTTLSALIHQSAETRIDLGTMPVSQETLQREKRRSVILSLSYAAAAILILALSLVLFQVSRTIPSATAISLNHSTDASFEIERAKEDTKVQASLQPGDRITLNRGLLQLTFPNEVEAIVEGPSRINLRSNSAIDLDGGTAWFRVPKAGRGFTVRTDLAKIIDLGTEFGVLTDLDDQLQIHVTRGQVRVEPFAANDSDFTLKQNQAVSLNSSGHHHEIQPQPKLFRQKFTESIPYLHWSFNHLYQGAFPASGTLPDVDQYHAKLHRTHGRISESDLKKAHVESPHGMALALNGDGLFAASTFSGIGGNAPRTVVAWIRHRNHPHLFPQLGSHHPLDDPYPGYGATTPFGNQAYLLDYGSTGITTSTTGLDETIAAHATYSVSFNLAARPGVHNALYRVELVAFDPQRDDAARRNHSSDRLGTVLAVATGEASAHDMSEHDQLHFATKSDHPAIGKKLAIRLVHTGQLVQSNGRTRHSGRVLYDNIQLTKNHGGQNTTLFSEGFEAPIVNGYAPHALIGPRWVKSSTQQGLFNQQPPFLTPFLTWGIQKPGELWSSFIYHSSQPTWSTATGPLWFTSADDADRDAAIPTNRWTHVATVFTGNTNSDGTPEIIHYLDAHPLKTRPAFSLHQSPTAIDSSIETSLHIGALPNAGPNSPTLNADIDELFLFRTALNRDEILLLMEKNSATALKK